MKKVIFFVLIVLNLTASDFTFADKNSTKLRSSLYFSPLLTTDTKPYFRQTCENLGCIMDDSWANKEAYFKNAALIVLNADDDICLKGRDYFSSREFEFTKNLRQKILLSKFGRGYKLVPFEPTMSGKNKIFLRTDVTVDGKIMAKIEINGRILPLTNQHGYTTDMQIYNLKIKELK
ncbi:hypothetical protein KDD93_07685 [Campylobacter sp. faydin G-24]|uniref:Flagellar protein n=1 Tax=Campylobacter anatolicus TaxID=2829105 RepID=A0ABS5HJM4_9BACT|nr:hypothetical protein [Campylobacter anatolicus]MBR8464444.1 hypothetical protein [Campylobacter anatolicus]